MADAALAEAGVDLGGITDWQEAAAISAAAGSPLMGLPQGLRVRPNGRSEHFVGIGASSPDSGDKPKAKGVPLPSLRDIVTLVFFVVGSLLMLALQRATRADQTPALVPCKQCSQDWWDHFWEWRMNDSASERPATAPGGMEWEWDATTNHTDWFGVSAELVDTVVATYVDPALGPVLHVGCGDSPMPELLYRAGFHAVEHIDIVPQVVSTMKARYPSDLWPGMNFSVRDFLGATAHGGGPPPPLNRFAAVIDKAGIWDWLQDEASEHLPRLLESVREALMIQPQRGVYIIVTKQSPFQLSETLARARANFLVETSQALGQKGIAWCYVLEPL